MDELSKKRDPKLRLRRPNLWWAVGSVALLTLALVGLLTLVRLTSEQRRVTECIQGEVRAERAATIALSNATLTMLDGVLSPGGTVESRTKGVQDWQEAYRQYLAALVAADARPCVESG